MLNIHIEGNYYIKSDPRNIMLVEEKVSQKGESKGQKYDDFIGYYATIEHALKDYFRIKINTSDATSVNQLVKEIKETKKIIEKTMRVWEEFDGKENDSCKISKRNSI